MNWLYKTLYLWWGTLLNLDAVGRNLELLQLNMSDLVDFQWETLSSLRRGWAYREVGGGAGREEGGRIVVGM